MRERKRKMEKDLRKKELSPLIKFRTLPKLNKRYKNGVHDYTTCRRELLPGDLGVPPTPVVSGIQPRPFPGSTVGPQQKKMTFPQCRRLHLHHPSGVILRATAVKIILARILDETRKALHFENPRRTRTRTTLFARHNR